MQRKLPGFSMLANLRIANKLAIMVAVMAVPIAALLFVQYQDGAGAISDANAESRGLDYVSSVMPFLKEVQLHRGLAQKVLSGDANSRDALARSTSAADAQLGAINELDKRYGKGLKTGAFLTVLNDGWAAARETPETQSFDASSALHTRLINEGIMPLLTQVALESKLVLDPDLETRSIITALTQDLPRMTEALSRTRSDGTAALIQRKGQAATDAQKQFIAGQVAVAEISGATMERNLEIAMAGSERFNESLATLVRRATIARQTFLSSASDDLMQAPAIAPTASESFFLLGGSAVDLANQLLTEAEASLQADFEARADSAQTSFYQSGVTALLGVTLALALAVFISATITRPISHLAEVADRMSLGDLDVEIDVTGNNEVGQLAESLRRMQASLRSAIERLRMRRAA